MATVLVVLTAIVVPTDASAQTQSRAEDRPCVTQREYRAVDTGWRQSRVADRFGVVGRQIGSSDDPYEVGDGGVTTVWKYPTCAGWNSVGSYVGVGYSNNRKGASDKRMRVWGKVPNRPERLLRRYYEWAPRPHGDGGRPCVTRKEYRDVHWGWRIGRVDNHFDTRGAAVGYSNSVGYADSVRMYRKCST